MSANKGLGPIALLAIVLVGSAVAGTLVGQFSIVENVFSRKDLELHQFIHAVNTMELLKTIAKQNEKKSSEFLKQLLTSYPEGDVHVSIHNTSTIRIVKITYENKFVRLTDQVILPLEKK